MMNGLFVMLATMILGSGSLASARAQQAQYGDLDFSRLSPGQEQFFWERLSTLALEEAIVVHCGAPDEFEEKAQQAIRSCVTVEALHKADSFFKIHLRESLAQVAHNQFLCEPGAASKRAWLGVNMQQLAKDGSATSGPRLPKGALIISTFDGSPAAAADIRANDIILAVDGEYIGGPEQLSEKLQTIGPNREAQFLIDRGGKKIMLTATLSTPPFKGPALADVSKTDLSHVLAEITDMCQRCKTTIWAAFCH